MRQCETHSSQQYLISEHFADLDVWSGRRELRRSPNNPLRRVRCRSQASNEEERPSGSFHVSVTAGQSLKVERQGWIADEVQPVENEVATFFGCRTLRQPASMPSEPA